ncbi:hypothetical protein [Paludibacterium denitrificans]|uniref:Uncharacterized protein n=1 Tax=Paludibacterium denitrificans TaxID=2675226 RepID=A0A844G8B1_9NEIS|nr:hypothetical protein [Paludibacterium denitrificans]MTD32616.1 hypothetical protein [Paludibacterium denitrificans]
MDDRDVVRAVRFAFERFSAQGVKAASSFGEVRGGESARGRELAIMEAGEIVQAVIRLEARFNLVLMARVNDGSMAFLHGVFDDLVSFVAYHDPDSMAYGKAGLQYWVRHWLTGFGSFREFGRENSIHHETAGNFYRQHVEAVLHGWLVAACGELEPLLEKIYGMELTPA